jgi:hypothetical protein
MALARASNEIIRTFQFRTGAILLNKRRHTSGESLNSL